MNDIEQKILSLLKDACSIRPSEEFRARSRERILSAAQTPSLFHSIRRELAENLTFGLALGMASIMLLVIFGGFTYWDRLFPGVSPTLSAQDLMREAENLDFKIQLKEAKYLDTSAQQIGALLTEIKEGDADENESVDDLLDKVIF